MSTEASTSAAAASAPVPSVIPNQAAVAPPAPAAPAATVPAPAAGTPPAPAAAPAAGDPPATAPATGEPKPDLSRGFASLAREEQRIRTEREALKADKAQLQQLAAARSNPREAMRLLGFTDDQVLESLAGGTGAPAPEDRIARIEKTLAERDAQAQADRQRAEQAQAAARAEQVITQFRSDVTAQLKAAGDKYALIAAYGAEGEVIARIEKTVMETGVLPQLSEVADAVEREQEAKARRALEVPKLKLVPNASENGPSGSTATLTNRGTAGPSAQPTAPLPLDPDARTAEILRRRRAASAS